MSRLPPPHIPDARQHLARYQGAYANTARARYRPKEGESTVEDTTAEDSTCEDSTSEDTSTWGTTEARGKEDEASSLDAHRLRSWAPSGCRVVNQSNEHRDRIGNTASAAGQAG